MQVSPPPRELVVQEVVRMPFLLDEPFRAPVSRQIQAEQVEEMERVYARVEEAASDGSGRLRLYLNSTRAPAIPDDVGRIATLRELYCQDNPFVKCFPSTIGRLAATLEILDVSRCALEALPEEVSTLLHLRILNASNNRLRFPPWHLDGLSEKLETLDLSHNRIRAFSYPCFKLFVALLTPPVNRYMARRTLLLNNNEFFQVRDSAEELVAFLPPSVERCTACHDRMDPAAVYVVFEMLQWESTSSRENRAPSMTQQQRRSQLGETPSEEAVSFAPPREEGVWGDGPSLRVPFVLPYCGKAACNLAIHRQREQQKLTEKAMKGRN